MENKLQFEYAQSIDANKIVCLLCSAFDGGITYWCEEATTVLPEGFDIKKLTWLDNPSMWVNTRKCYLAPLVSGGSVILMVHDDGDDADVEKYTLNIDAINNGIRVMSSKYPKHWADVLTENDDAATGDVFVQCCLFGDIIYG